MPLNFSAAEISNREVTKFLIHQQLWHHSLLLIRTKETARETSAYTVTAKHRTKLNNV